MTITSLNTPYELNAALRYSVRMTVAHNSKNLELSALRVPGGWEYEITDEFCPKEAVTDVVWFGSSYIEAIKKLTKLDQEVST